MDNTLQFRKIYEPIENSKDLNFTEITLDKNPDIYNKLNFGERPKVVDQDGQLVAPVINTLVYGYTVSSYEDAFNTFTAYRGISTHFIIDKDGSIDQLVHPTLRAWFAGYSPWDEQKIYDGKEAIDGKYFNKTSISLNDNGIGIWFVNKADGIDQVTLEQVIAGVKLGKSLVETYHIPSTNILSYEDARVDSTTKEYTNSKGGEYFGTKLGMLPFKELAQGEIGLYPEITKDLGLAVLANYTHDNARVQCIKSELKAFGFGLDASSYYDTKTHQVARVFHKHFNQEFFKSVSNLEETGQFKHYWTNHDQFKLKSLLEAKFAGQSEIIDCGSIASDAAILTGSEAEILANFIRPKAEIAELTTDTEVEAILPSEQSHDEL